MSTPVRARAGGPRLVLGGWEALFGLVAIWATFAAINPRFLSAVNLTNLTLQIVAVGAVAAGVVLVLLIGEIDLSVGAVAGLGAAVVAVLSAKHGWPAAPAVVAGLATGAAAGALHGWLVTRIGIPSFVVTLAGLLVWQGALLAVLGDTGTVHVADGRIAAIAGTFLAPAAGWALGAAVLALCVAVALRRARPGGAARSRSSAAGWVLVGLGALGSVAVFNADRGMPLAVVLFVAMLALVDVALRRTRPGRHTVAIGSDATVARRAGIAVDRIKLLVFALASLLAVTGGILRASRLLAVNQSSGGTDLMLAAVAAAVIGGTSLFGGRGSVWSALLGSLVVGSVANGLDLLGVSSSVRLVVTGMVLAVAVGFDTLSRRPGRHGAAP